MAALAALGGVFAQVRAQIVKREHVATKLAHHDAESQGVAGRGPLGYVNQIALYRDNLRAGAILDTCSAGSMGKQMAGWLEPE